MLRSHRAVRSASLVEEVGDARVVWAFRGGELQTMFDSVGRVTMPVGTSFELAPGDGLEWCVVPLNGPMRLEGQGEVLDVTSSSSICRFQQTTSRRMSSIWATT